MAIDTFKKGDTVRLNQATMKVDTGNPDFTSCILEDGTTILIPTHLLRRTAQVKVLGDDPIPDLQDLE